MKAMRGLALLAAAGPVMAASTDPLSAMGVSLGKNGSTLSAPMQIVLLLTVMTLLPAVIMSVTPFLRIVVVLHFLRQALGTQTAPSNQVLIGLSLFLATVCIGALMFIAVEIDVIQLAGERAEHRRKLLKPPHVLNARNGRGLFLRELVTHPGGQLFIGLAQE